MLARRKEEGEAYEAVRRNGVVWNGGTGKLIENSPQKPRATSSKNTELLIDLDLNLDNNNDDDEIKPTKKARASYASAARSTDVQKEQFEMNFLD
jgi:hypothetical protein